MEIKEITDKNIWEDFLKKCEEKTFLQSWNWGEFNKMMGDRIWRFGVYDNELIGAALVIKVKAKRGDFLFVPHGPVVSRAKALVLKTLMPKLKELAIAEKASHIRIAPVTESGLVVFEKLGFRGAPTFVHPELTWELDITPPESELFKNMRKTTRNLIRRAEKEGVEIVEASGVEEFDALYQKTKERQHFTPFSLDYLKNEFKAFSADNQILVLLGKYNGETVASGIFVLWQGTGFYHHGASSQKYAKIPVSYLLLWEAIKKAKDRECERFNFWGVVPDEAKSHPWHGLSLFKKGFGGQEKEYVKTHDFVLNPRYWLSFAVEIIRRMKRGL